MYACGGRRNPWKEVVEWWFNGGQCSFNALVGDFGVFHRDKYVTRLLIFSKSIVYIFIQWSWIKIGEASPFLSYIFSKDIFIGWLVVSSSKIFEIICLIIATVGIYLFYFCKMMIYCRDIRWGFWEFWERIRKYVYIYIVIALDIVLSGSLNRFYGEKWVNAIIECAVQRRNQD